ncbi:isocitrate/isopropylmalate family dehydrogenase [Streptomyces sp. NPDC002143]
MSRSLPLRRRPTAREPDGLGGTGAEQIGPACAGHRFFDTGLDWVVVRENSEGEYAGLGGRNLGGRGPGGEVAVRTALFTEVGCERIMRFAFDLARTRSRSRRKVSSASPTRRPV